MALSVIGVGPVHRLVGWAALAGLAWATAGCAEPPRTTADSSPAGAVLVAAASSTMGSDAGAPIGSPYGSYLAGLFAGHERDLTSAADFMLQALASDPDDEQLLNRAFMMVASDGRHAETVELARRLDAREPDHGLAGLVLAVDATQRGDFAEAERFLQNLPERGLSTLTAPLMSAWIRVAQNNLSGALDRMAPLRNKDGFDVFHGLHVALMNDVAGQVEAARAAYEEALEAASRPSLRLTWVAGNFFERTGAKERAEELYRQFLDGNPDSRVMASALARLPDQPAPEPIVAEPAQGIAEALFNIASLLSQERAEEIALIHAHLALRLHPDFLLARVLIGEVLQAQDRGEEAIAIYRRVPPESPFAWMVRLRIADELEDLGRTEDAVAELEQLAAARPERFEPLFRLGNLLRVKERYEEAVEAYDRAEARLAELEEQRPWTLYYFRGIALERLSQWPRAEADFLRALELEPEQPFVLNYLAYSWVEKKLNLDKAKSMLVRAVELRPEDGFIVDSLGWVYYRLGDFERGVKYLERAVELRPQDPVINDHLGDAYWRVGRHAEARFQWRRALSLGPEEDTIPVIESKLERGLNETPQQI